MKEEKSDKDLENGLGVLPLVGPTSQRSHFEGLPIRDKLNALSWFLASTHGRVKRGELSSLKNAELKRSADTCMLCLSVLVSALEESGVSGWSVSDEPE